MAKRPQRPALRTPRAALASTGEITADAGLAQAKKSAAYFKKLLTSMPEHEGMDSVREADHLGHHIVIRTTYKVTIDGKPLRASLGVTNGGAVHYHGMPNVGFASAVDLVEAIIDTFPGEFTKGSNGGDHDHDGHDHGGHGGMRMGRTRRKSSTRKRAAKRRHR